MIDKITNKIINLQEAPKCLLSITDQIDNQIEKYNKISNRKIFNMNNDRYLIE